MDLYPRNKLHVKEVKKFIVIFYLVGALGFLIPATKNLFMTITPFALLVSLYLIMVYHTKHDFKTWGVFLTIYFLGFFIEVVGVKTGWVFGSYRYGKALGIKILETPLMIGVNWLFLVYVATSITDKMGLKPWFTVIMAPAFMLGYDLVLEQVAPKMRMWNWEGSIVPLQNYISWYVIGLLFVGLFKLFKITTENPLARILFICQFLFFVSLMLFL